MPHGAGGCLACVALGEPAVSGAENERLFHAVHARRTNRHPFAEREITLSLQEDLRAAAYREGAWLVLIEDSARRMDLINLITHCDRALGHDLGFVEETLGWLRPSRGASVDGIPEYALGHGGLMSHYTSDLGEALANKDRLLAWSAPVLAVLETREDTPQRWLAAGQALARVLLRAAAEGVQASFFNSPIEAPGGALSLDSIVGCEGVPQLILRFGYPLQPASATPRRPVCEVVANHYA
jgi:hypothetical protein